MHLYGLFQTFCTFNVHGDNIVNIASLNKRMQTSSLPFFFFSCANRIKDVIDEYIHQVAPHCHDWSGFVIFLIRIGRSVKQLIARHGMASEIQDITMPLREMKERSLSYGLRPLIRESPDEASSGKSTHDEQYYP